MASCTSRSVVTQLKGATIPCDVAFPGMPLHPGLGPSTREVGTNWGEPREGLPSWLGAGAIGTGEAEGLGHPAWGTEGEGRSQPSMS